LETGEGAGNLHLPAELLEGYAALASQALQQARIGTVGAVQHQNSFPLKQQARQEIVAEPRRVLIAMEDRQTLRRQRPQPTGWRFRLAM
jgi:hypothetical protein